MHMAMNMNMKRSMKIRGFMCQSPAATAVCMTGDARSVIVPRRPDRTLLDHATLVNTANYTRLVESRRFGTSAHKIRSTTKPLPPIKSNQDIIASKRSTATMPPIKIHQDTDRDRQALQKPSPLTSSDQIFQVVVMRVSLHCQGCAGKVKKHLSKMEGVTSFSIDLESKRVTVMGHVSPEGVLESISKVKRAEFWPC